MLLTPDYPPARGGIQLLARRLAEGLDGFERKVLAHDSPAAGAFDADSAVSIGRVRAPARLGPLRHLPLNAVALRDALAFGPEAVLSLHVATSPAAAVVRRTLGTRTVQYFYAKEIGARPRLAAFAARNADHAIAISGYCAQLLRDTGAEIAGLTKIPPGVDLPADPSPLASEQPTLVTIARLQDRYKGHDVLIDALVQVRAQIPDVHWVVIGDGPLRPWLEGLARSRGLGDAVRFLGSVSDERRDEWLRRADLLAMPSRLPDGGRAGEGFGIVYLEAGAHGKPVVAGSVAGALDAVRDGETGLLVDPADPAAVAAAIVRLLRDPDLARRLGEGGARYARSLAWPAVVARVQELLLEQLAAGRPAPDLRRRSQLVPRSSADGAGGAEVAET